MRAFLGRGTLLFALVVGLVGTAGPAAATSAGGPAVTAIRFGMSTVSVAGIETRTVEVAIDLSDPAGVKSGQFNSMEGPYWLPAVTFTRTGGSSTSPAPWFTVNNFQLVAGDDTNGTWAASWPIIASYDGTWEPTRVVAQDTAGDQTDVDPRLLGIDPTLTVHGTSIPTLSLSFRPAVVHRGQTLTEYGYLGSAQGDHFGERPLRLGTETLCVEEFGGSGEVTTAVDGRWSLRLPTDTPDALYPALHCVLLLLPDAGTSDRIAVEGTNTGIVEATGYARAQYALLGVHAASSSVPAGSDDAVTGSVWPYGGLLTGSLRLQRLVGRTWRTVARATVRTSGRFTLTADPPARGRNVYRVVKPGDWCYPNVECHILGTATPAFVITGT